MFLIEPERGCSRLHVLRDAPHDQWRHADRRSRARAGADPRAGAPDRLVGAAVTDHPGIVELVRTLVEDGREVGISSLRADRLCAARAGLPAGEGRARRR